MKPRKIIHVDLDAFFCSVEELINPDLKRKKFAVGGKPGERGVIASCSYPARKFGVRSAMPTTRALEICPELILINPGHSFYGEYSERVMLILGQFSGLIEQISIDEAFLDVSDLETPGLDLAREIQTNVIEQTHLPCSIGVASNKLVAKIATDVGKGEHNGDNPPCAITFIPPGEESRFLAPLPIRMLWGVGPKMGDRLEALGIRKIGELAEFPKTRLVSLFGKWGEELSQHARGIDERPVSCEDTVKSISQEITFNQDTSEKSVIFATLLELSSQVGFRLRKVKLSGDVVRLKIRWSDFSTHTRQITKEQCTDQDGLIYQSILQLLDGIWDGKRKIRLLGVAISGLKSHQLQLGLWDDNNDKERRLLQAVDLLKDRFGKKIITRAAKLKKLDKLKGDAS